MRQGAQVVDAAAAEIARQIRERMLSEGIRQADIRQRCGFSRKQSRRASEFLRDTGDQGWGIRAAIDLASKLGVPVTIRIGDRELVA